MNPFSHNAANNKPRTLPSLRSLNILPSPSSALTRGLVHARDFEDDDLAQDEPCSSAQMTRKRSRADTSISRASHRSTSRIDSILDFSHDGPRPSSSTSACSSIASLTSSSSYTSHNTVSSEHRHHGQPHHPGDKRVITHPQPPYITKNRLQQSRSSSSSSLKDSYHPFGYYNAACGLPQQLLPLNLDSQTVRHVSASHGSITPVATPVSAHRLFSKQDPLECAEDRPSSSSFFCSHYPQAPHSIAILDRPLAQPNHHPRPRQSPEIEAAEILAAVAESVCSKTDASLTRRLSPFHPVHKRESESDVPGDQHERQYCQEEHMTRRYSRLRPSRSPPGQTSAMYHPYYPFHRIEGQDRHAPSTSTASDTIEASEHQPYELYMAPLRNITDRARQKDYMRPEMRGADKSFDSECGPGLRRATFSETQDHCDVASGWRFDARKVSVHLISAAMYLFFIWLIKTPSLSMIRRATVNPKALTLVVRMSVQAAAAASPDDMIETGMLASTLAKGSVPRLRV